MSTLNLSQVAKLLDCKEEVVHRWLRQGVIPYHTTGGNVWFRESEIRSWAACVQLRTKSAKPAAQATGNLFIDALHRGGVFHQVKAKDANALLEEMTALVQLPAQVNRETLLRVLREREAMASTGLGNGVAIPHPANPAILRLKQPIIACYFPKTPVPFNAPDQIPIFAAFLILASDSANHLRILGQIARFLKSPDFRNMLGSKPSEDQLQQWIANAS